MMPAEYVERRGRENVTADEIVRAVRPQGRAAVPDSVKAELLQRIKQFILAIQ
jgi:enhancer of yellow 2 transcription factor